MPGKMAKRSVMEEWFSGRVRKCVGSGSGLIPAIRVSTDFTGVESQNVEDMVRANCMRLLITSDNGKPSFRTTALKCCDREECAFAGPQDRKPRTYYTTAAWTDSELRDAHHIECTSSLLQADPLDSTVYYIIFEEAGCIHRTCEVDIAVKRLVRELVLCRDDGTKTKKYWAKAGPDVALEQAFHEQMFSVLLPYFKRLLSANSQGKSPSDALDPVTAVEEDDSVSIFVAYRDC